MVWIGGALALGAFVAPATFDVLLARDPIAGGVLAAQVFGEALARFQPATYGAGVLLLVLFAVRALIGPRPSKLAIRMGLTVVMLAIAIYCGVFLTARIVEVQHQIGGPVGALSAADPRRELFDRLHNLSTMLMSANILGGLILLYWEAKE